MHHQQIVALTFRVLGWALGVPSLLLLLDLSVALIGSRFRPAPDESHPLEIGTYGLVGLLVNSTQVVCKVLDGVSVVATWLMAAAAIIAGIVLVLAILLYFTANGIDNHATWARVVAMLISVGVVFISLGAKTILPRHLIPAPCLTIGASCYALWILGRKFK